MVLPRAVSFWLLGGVLVLLLATASAPSPLYGLYQRAFGFETITLTIVYAVYALGGLATLLVMGRLADHLGRRPILAMALVVEIAAMVAFFAARDVALLFVGRFLTGAAVGLGAGPVSAWILDLQAPDRPGQGSLVGAVGPLLGLGLGAFASGVVVQLGAAPLHSTFAVLAAASALALLALWAIPDRLDRRPGWLDSLRPNVGVPSPARAMFLAGLPALVAMWALAGLYLALGPSLIAAISGANSGLAGGTLVLALVGAGALGSVAAHRMPPRTVLVRGNLLLVGGVTISLLGLATASSPWFFVGTIVAGLGFGPAFSAFVASTAPLAPPHGRAALVAAIYVVIYLSISLPAILGGAAASLVGLRDTALAFGLVVMLLASVTTVRVARGMSTA